MNKTIPAARQGFSVVEVMLAVALFVIFASGMAIVVISGLDNNRLGGEETIANQYASEGLEAVRSIKNQAYSYLQDSSGTGVIRNPGNLWAFSGANNTFDKYTRVITIADVFRDGGGNIVSLGGTLDPDTKKVTSTVIWNFSSARADSVVLTTYYTNWKAGSSEVTCAQYCVNLGTYTIGTCRQNATQCANHGETHEAGGDAICTTNFPGNPSEDTCCCK